MPMSDGIAGPIASLIALLGVGGLLGWLHMRLNRIEHDSEARDEGLRVAHGLLSSDVNQRFERLIDRLGGVATREDLRLMKSEIMDAIRDRQPSHHRRATDA